MNLRRFLGMLMVTILAAGLAGWAGVSYGLHQTPPDLDRMLHEQLDLTKDQDARIENLEEAMASKRKSLQTQMVKANHELADAIAKDHAYGVPEKAAIEHFHAAMIELQEDTLHHVMAMRAVLNPDQARRFDAIIAKKLTDANP
jgi:Spy/CpxP family protein refolding chaperone